MKFRIVFIPYGYAHQTVDIYKHMDYVSGMVPSAAILVFMLYMLLLHDLVRQFYPNSPKVAGQMNAQSSIHRYSEI